MAIQMSAFGNRVSELSLQAQRVGQDGLRYIALSLERVSPSPWTSTVKVQWLWILLVMAKNGCWRIFYSSKVFFLIDCII